VEELWRYDSPVQRTARVTTAEVRIGDKTIPRHALVVAAIGAANRDPERFAQPDRLTSCAPTRTTSRSASASTSAWMRRSAAPRARHRNAAMASSTLRGLRELPLTF
jgi:Cytochrome P450